MLKKMILVLFSLSLVLFAGCGWVFSSKQAEPARDELMLATTTSTYDTGLLDFLLPAFEETYNIRVKVVALGTGAALELGKNGDCDVVLAHAKDSEVRLVEEGFFVERHDVMFNDFIIVGPADDPAGVRSAPDAAQALQLIATKGSRFISRSDDSGTHKKELFLWQGRQPGAPWYIRAGMGMADTLRMADERGAYTLTDRGTFYKLDSELDLAVLFDGDPNLFNLYGVMAVNPDRHSHVNIEGAKLLINFFISDEGQSLIKNFRPGGRQLFYPIAERGD